MFSSVAGGGTGARLRSHRDGRVTAPRPYQKGNSANSPFLFRDLRRRGGRNGALLHLLEKQFRNAVRRLRENLRGRKKSRGRQKSFGSSPPEVALGRATRVSRSMSLPREAPPAILRKLTRPPARRRQLRRRSGRSWSLRRHQLIQLVAQDRVSGCREGVEGPPPTRHHRQLFRGNVSAVEVNVKQ